MKCSVAGFCLVLLLLPVVVFGQTRGQRTKRESSQTTSVKPSTNQTLKICQGLAIPDGYIIVGYQTTASCPHGAYVLRRQEARPQARQASEPQVSEPQVSEPQATEPNSSADLIPGLPQSPAQVSSVSRPRKVGSEQSDAVAPTLQGATSYSRPAQPPTLSGVATGTPVNSVAKDPQPLDAEKTSEDEVGEGDVVRIDTNFVTVPVSVLDRQGRFVPNLRREDFSVFENGKEQPIAHFESTEKPFTVALVLDTSASTHFHLWEIKEAAIAFAKQLRPQDRVIVVTFSDQVMLLTEATNNLDVVTAVVEQNVRAGNSTRLYDAIDLVINERLNKIPGRKSIVLFTDGVDTSSYLATYESSLRQAEELDALIYPIQYDTSDYQHAMQRGNATIVTTTTNNWPFPNTTQSQVIYGPPQGPPAPGTSKADYERADKFLNQLADKTGARLYKANDRAQLSEAFTKIAEELRRQYSLGYYPQADAGGDERRLIKVKVKQPNLAVRARDSYVQRAPKPTQ